MAEKIARFEDLLVWQKAHQMVLRVYRITGSFPAEERFGLSSQMRRAAVSVPANLAEGFKKRGVRDKLNFYNIAQGSLEELRYYLILSKDLGYMPDNRDMAEAAEEIAKMLHGLIASVAGAKGPSS
ncbi:MAG: four helix bundle protein [candidate division WOR-3 bacterium]|nr:four helix bundle protein [candidate division WOR-3 bacterium]